MEKNRFDSREALWTAHSAVTCGAEAKKEETQRSSAPCGASREDARTYHYQYLYLEEEEAKKR